MSVYAESCSVDESIVKTMSVSEDNRLVPRDDIIDERSNHIVEEVGGGGNSSTSLTKQLFSTVENKDKLEQLLCALLNNCGKERNSADPETEDSFILQRKTFSPNKSVVKVYVHGNKYNYENPWAAPTQSKSYGSGFIIDGRRIVTNAHVVSDSSFIQCRKAGSSKKYPARVKRIMHSVDLAILEINKDKNKVDEFFHDTEALKIGDTPHVGDTVRAYGFPWGGEEMSLTKGVVSRVEMNRAAHGGGCDVLSCDMDTAIAGGNSGGPVMAIPGDDRRVFGNQVDDDYVEEEALVVGVVFQGYDTKEGGYMIASEVLRKAIELDDLNMTLKTPSLGISTQNLENPYLRTSLGLNGNESEFCFQRREEKVENDADSEEVEKNTDSEKVEKNAEGEKNAEVEKNADSEKGDKKGEEKDFVLVSEERINESEIIEGGVMIHKIAEFSPVRQALQERDVLLQLDEFKVGENGTVEFRKGERTRWSYVIGQKSLGESVKLKLFRNGRVLTHEVVLSKSNNDIAYAAEKQYDVKPKFLLKAGVLFQPLTWNLCVNAKQSHYRVGSALQSKINDFRTSKHPDYVLMSKVLQDESTTGYEMTNQIVEKINGVEVHSMEDVVSGFAHFEPDLGKQEHVIELENGKSIVLISADLEKDTKRIASTYDITNLKCLTDDCLPEEDNKGSKL